MSNSTLDINDQTDITDLHTEGSMQQLVKTRAREVLAMGNATLDIQPETLQFLCGSGSIKSPEEFIQILLDVGNMLDVQRFILYRIVNATEAEILLIFSLCEDEPEKVGQIITITMDENPNLIQAAKTGQISQIPVPDVGIDAAFPIGGLEREDNTLIVGVDNIYEGRVFSKNDIVTLKPTALSIGAAYNAWHAIHKKWFDKLTGLANRAALDSIIDEGVNSFGTPVPRPETVVFMDIDFFGKFNKKHGHDTGDAVLRHVAHIIKHRIEELGGLAFRYGGEEFVATFDSCLSAAEIDSIRAAVENSTCTYGWSTYNVRLSVGFSVKEHYPFNKTTTDEDADESNMPLSKTLIRSANHALLVAKRKGRNRTTEWSEEVEKQSMISDTAWVLKSFRSKITNLLQLPKIVAA